MLSVAPQIKTAPAGSFDSVVTLFSNASRPPVCVIGAGEFLQTVTRLLEPLNYLPETVPGGFHQVLAERPQADAIILLDGAEPGALDMCESLDERQPKILVSPETGFGFRIRCARANVSTIIASPINQAELIHWLEHLGGQVSEQPPSILLVDDDPLASALYAELLRAAGMIVTVLNDPLRIIQAIDGAFYDIILMDLQMPDVDGIEIAKIIRQFQSHLSIPIVFLSAEEDRKIQMRARQFGGDEFISKRADPEALVSLINLRVERARVMRSLIERDGLTGLLNHRRFKERVGYEMARLNRTKLQFSVAMIDVDHFKTVNDSWGHPVGDQVLSVLARTLVGWVRKTDVVGRYGGEEFAVLLLDTSPDAVFEVLDNFRKHFSKIVFGSQEEPFSLTISIGVAGSETNHDAGALFTAADEALYRAKRNGRNQVVVAAPGPAREEPREAAR